MVIYEIFRGDLMSIKKSNLFIVSLLSLLLLVACTNEPVQPKEGQQIDEQKEESEFEIAVR